MTYDPDCCYRGCDTCPTYHKGQTGTPTTSGLPRLSHDEANALAEKLGLSLSETIALSLQDTTAPQQEQFLASLEAARERYRTLLREAVMEHLDVWRSMQKPTPSSEQVVNDA